MASALTPSTDYQLATKKYVDDNGGIDANSDVSLNQSLIVAGDVLLGGTFGRVTGSTISLSFGASPTTTDLGDFGAFAISNYTTTGGGTDTLMTGSDSHIGESLAISDDGTIVAIGAPQGKF